MPPPRSKAEELKRQREAKVKADRASKSKKKGKPDGAAASSSGYGNAYVSHLPHKFNQPLAHTFVSHPF